MHKKVKNKYLSLTNIKAHDKYLFKKKYLSLMHEKNIWDKYLLPIHKKIRYKFVTNT